MDVTQVLLLALGVVLAVVALRHLREDEPTEGVPQAAAGAGTDLVVRAPQALPSTPPSVGALAADSVAATGSAEAADEQPSRSQSQSQSPSDEGPAAISPPAPLIARTRLFGLATTRQGQSVSGPYAVVGYVTNGFAPMKDALIEIAVVHTTGRGDVTDECVTLLQPPEGAAGATFLHGLARGELALAPRFAEDAAGILTRLDGRVVVAHHADLLEQFLDAALMAAGVLVPSRPALDTYALATRTFPTRNHRLTTLATHLGIAERPGTAALADARTVTALLPHILARHGDRLRYPCPLPQTTRATGGYRGKAVHRAHRSLPTTPAEAWLWGLLTQVPGGARELNDPKIAAYLQCLTLALTAGTVVTDEVRLLSGLLARAGYSAGDIRGLHERLCEALREAAFEQHPFSSRQVRQLRAAATSLGVATYFDDLVPPSAPPAPEPGSGTFSRPVRKPVPPPAPAYRPRCGRCLHVGHYTSTCPSRPSGTFGPVGPVTSLGG